MAVAIYTRVSTDEQRERQSIATQREELLRYCQRQSLKIAGEYADDGVSGTVPFGQRPAGRRLLHDARLGKIGEVIAFRLDRIGRSTLDTLMTVEEFGKLGVGVRSSTEAFETATPSGRLMLTMLAGFAAHERESIRERSLAGTNRLAEAGTWLGGIVPFGYRQSGENAKAHLQVCESEAATIRLMFTMSGKEGKSCQAIADHLNRTGVPTGAPPTPRPGKRARRVAKIWRPGHIRNLLVSATYKGEHHWGKRTKNRNRKVIVRAVPAIVTPDLWEAAQATLRANRLMIKRADHVPYLLKGKIRCASCGLAYVGTRTRAGFSHIYKCVGRQQYRAIHGPDGMRCPSRALNGTAVDSIVWADVEQFVRNPGEVLEKLRARLSIGSDERQRREKQLGGLRARLEDKENERERVLALYRRGRIDDATLDQQLDQVEHEKVRLMSEIRTNESELSVSERAQQLQTAEQLLATLRKRLSGPIPPDLKRRIVEVLVARVVANTVEQHGVKESQLAITYRFAAPAEPLAATLPQLHLLAARCTAPDVLNTVGDHIRRRRLERHLLQKYVAKAIGVTVPTITNWEKNHTQPEFRHMPAIIKFLGYNPTPQADTPAKRLVQARTALGLNQKEYAEHIGVPWWRLALSEQGCGRERARFPAFGKTPAESIQPFLVADKSNLERCHHAEPNSRNRCRTLPLAGLVGSEE